ncbi:MAG TPA: hypothetical protein VLB76_24545 [Thermoanaerobaculia bacterium]|nr:hypothetical protein [Thermoanaerobaculia bacterium]
MLPIPELATAAVTALVPYLAAAGTEGAKKVGSVAGEKLAGLFGKLKARLSPAGQVALSNLEKTPTDPNTQTILGQQLKKQLGEDADLHAVLTALLEELRSAAPAVTQTSTIVGTDNSNVQISGSGNQVGGLGRKS